MLGLVGGMGEKAEISRAADLDWAQDKQKTQVYFGNAESDPKWRRHKLA